MLLSLEVKVSSNKEYFDEKLLLFVKKVTQQYARLQFGYLSFLNAIKSLTRSQRAVNELRCSSTSSFSFLVSFGSFLTFSPSASVSIIWGVFSSTSFENICKNRTSAEEVDNDAICSRGYEYYRITLRKKIVVLISWSPLFNWHYLHWKYLKLLFDSYKPF